jgi:hypothetical protein
VSDCYLLSRCVSCEGVADDGDDWLAMRARGVEVAADGVAVAGGGLGAGPTRDLSSSRRPGFRFAFAPGTRRTCGSPTRTALRKSTRSPAMTSIVATARSNVVVLIAVVDEDGPGQVREHERVERPHRPVAEEVAGQQVRAGHEKVLLAGLRAALAAATSAAASYAPIPDPRGG